MRIAIVGANGQVGTEVTLLLASQPEIEVRPIVRSRSGSAYLRYRGVPVMHGSISDPAQARRLLDGVDVVANLALAIGTPAASMEENRRIIAQTFAAAPPRATVVLFSTLAVHGLHDPSRGRQRTMYGKLKLENERQALAEGARTGRPTYVFRLGHVGGPLQNITALWRNEIAAGTVVVEDPQRSANVTYTVTIADALLALAQKRAGAPGLYDLVNVPQWTWQEIYTLEAERLGMPLQITVAPASPARKAPSRRASMRSMALSAINRFGLKEQAMRLAAELPKALNDSMKADQYVRRAAAEIAALDPPALRPDGATIWPGLKVSSMAGLRPTRELIHWWQAVEQQTPAERKWAADL